VFWGHICSSRCIFLVASFVFNSGMCVCVFLCVSVFVCLCLSVSMVHQKAENLVIPQPDRTV
jgi:hypothetical protein